jgi:Flp pilus assembly protein TadB
MGSKTDTIIYIVALACALAAVAAVEGGLLTSILVGAGVAVVVTVVLMLVIRGATSRRPS